MPEDAPLIFGSSFMTIKGLYTPAPIWNNFDVFMIALIVAMIVFTFSINLQKENKKKRANSIQNF